MNKELFNMIYYTSFNHDNMEEHEILDQLDIGSPVTLGLNNINTQLTDTL